MIKNILINIFILSTAILIYSCNKSTEPTDIEDLNPNEIKGQPKKIEINIAVDSLKTEISPRYSVDYSTLNLNGTDLSYLKYIYPGTSYGIKVDKEFVVTLSDSFIVEINNCISNSFWSIDYGSIELGPHAWINSEVALLKQEKIVNPDSTTNYRFVFKSLKNGKGYISFIEESLTNQMNSNTSHGLVVGYTIEPLHKIILEIENIEWLYRTEEGLFSLVSVKLQGKTNVCRLRAMSYGDGIPMAIEIPINNNSFEKTINIAFSHVEGLTLTTNGELILYGTVGLPRVIKLINPKGLSEGNG
jgi:hypothetical protein